MRWPPVRPLIVWLLTTVAGAALGTTAAAQPPPQPIGRYVVDLRGSFTPFLRNVQLAANRGLNPPDTPGPGIGLDVGAHVYVLRWRVITFGLGASVHTSVATQSPGPRSPDPEGPALRKRFTAFAPQLSFNFGGRNGWSYVSGGLAPSRLSLHAVDAAAPPQRSANTLNYGGGARWFVNDRLAFSVDMRLYAISPLEETADEPGSPRMTQMVLSVGASFR